MVLGWWLIDALARNWAILVIIPTTVALLAVPALIIAKYVRISLNILRTTRPPLSRNPLDFEPLRGEPVSFTAYDGLRLSGMLLRGESASPRGMVLFAHEFCSDMHSCARYCRPLLEAGYDVFTFDFRGHGQSDSEPGYTPSQWVTDREIDDVRGALAFVQTWLEEQGRPRRVGIFGISRGACAAILAAAENPDVAALVCDGVYSTDTTIEYFMKRWAYIYARIRVVYENHPPVFWRFLRWCMIQCARREFRCAFPSVRKALLRMKPRPILFIHGARDSWLPLALSLQLYALAPQPKYHWAAPGARHNEAVIVHPLQYARLCVQFLDRHLAELPDARVPEPSTLPFAPPSTPRPPAEHPKELADPLSAA